jgi:porin-like protein
MLALPVAAFIDMQSEIPGRLEQARGAPGSSVALQRNSEASMTTVNSPLFVKGLLLSTASVLATYGAQAADLPVKAKPVEYVKICNLYGAGFYYVPGTDTCIKIGGYVRADYSYNTAGGGLPNFTGAPGRQTRADTADFATRARANMTFDMRTSTGYGVLRTYESIHIQNENQGTVTVVLPRSFVQWAGFTFGRSQSFVDIFYLDPYQYAGPYIGSSTDANGTNLAAYTFEFGNGITSTSFIEERRSAGLGRSVVNLSLNNALAVGTQATNSSNGQVFPDFGSALRVDQAWGTLGAFGVSHDASASYYATQGVACPGGAASAPVTTCGNPDSKLGWAAGGGGTIKLPMIAAGDQIGAQFVYSRGAAAYAANGHNSGGLFGGGNQVAVGWLTDGVFVTGSQVELTTAWSVVAAYEHFWTPEFKTSLYGAYLHVDYNANATSFICSAVRGTFNSAFNSVSNCDPDYNFWYVGARTQWNPVKDFGLGVDVNYTKVETAFAGTANLASGIGARPTGSYSLKDQGIVSVLFRAQRNY